VQPSQTYAQPALLFWNCGSSCGASFLTAKETGDLAQPLVGRATAYADIDGDGDLDLLITQNGRRAVLLRNDQALGHHWLRLRLVGRPGNHDAIGARVSLKAGDLTQERTVMPTRGYLSQVELPLTFGLGQHERVDSLVIDWPDGRREDVLAVPSTDQSLVLEEQPR